jgi:thiol-disulfide isomerase/thioredoxin
VTQTNQDPTAAGALRNDQNKLIFGEGFSFSGYERDAAFLNLGNGKFVDISGVSGIDSVADNRAGVFADFDNDGDLDIFSTTIQGQVHLLFRNNIGQDQPWIRVLLESDGTINADAVGSTVRIRTRAGTLSRLKSGGTGFVSQHDSRLHIGLGSADAVTAIEVTWPDARVETFKGEASPGSTVVLRRGTGTLRTLDVRNTRLPDPLTKEAITATRLRVSPGAPFPRLDLKTVSGDSRPLSAYLKPGRRLFVNVWATWCGPCAKEMPELEKLKAPLAARGIDLLGLNVDTEEGVDVSAYLKRLGVTYGVGVGGTKAIEQLYSGEEVVVPLSFIVDDTGTLREILPGWSAKTQQRLAQLAAGGTN